MELFEDPKLNLYFTLRSEYFAWIMNDPRAGSWDDFVKRKNLGVQFISTNKHRFYDTHRYEITDHRQWLLNKIKYGW